MSISYSMLMMWYRCAMNLILNIVTVVAAMTYVIICCMCCSYKCLSHSSYLWTCLTRLWEESRSYSRLSFSITCSVMLMSQLRCQLLMIIRVSLSLPTELPEMSNVPRLLLSGYVSVLRLCYCFVFLCIVGCQGLTIPSAHWELFTRGEKVWENLGDGAHGLMLNEVVSCFINFV